MATTQEAHRHLHRTQDDLKHAVHHLREAQQHAQQCSAAVEAAQGDHEVACQHAEYHDALSHLMKQASDSAMNTLHHERKALVRGYSPVLDHTDICSSWTGKRNCWVRWVHFLGVV